MTPKKLLYFFGLFFLLFSPVLALSFYAYTVFHQIILLLGALIAGWTALYLGQLFDDRERLSRDVFLQSYELRKVKETLESCQATGDQTDVYNERFLVSRLAEECERSRRYGRQFSTLLVAIDAFSQLAQRSGVVQASTIVQEVSRFLKESTRSVDIIIRSGEDRFVAILPETQLNQARIVAERIRYAVEKNMFKVEGRPVKVTVSIAIVAFDSTVHRNKEDVLNCLEKTFHEARRSGVNRVAAFSDEMR